MSIYGRGEQKKFEQTQIVRDRGYASRDIQRGITFDRKAFQGEQQKFHGRIPLIIFNICKHYTYFGK